MRVVHGFKVRGLTRKEIRDLKQFGFYHSFYSPPIHDPDKVDEGFELALSMCVEDPDDLMGGISNSRYLDLFRLGVMRETYGSEEEEKNLPTSGNGSQTKKG